METVGDSDYIQGHDSAMEPHANTMNILNRHRKQKIRDVSDTKQLFAEQFKFINNDPSLHKNVKSTIKPESQLFSLAHC